MNEAPLNFELAEPSHPERLLPQFALEVWMIPAAVALLLGIYAVVIVLRRKFGKSTNPLSIRAAAHARAEAELSEVESPSSRQAAVRCSLILRKYLATATSDPSLYETHNEFLMRHDSLAAMTEEAREAATAGFSRLAALKYAPEEGSEEHTPENVVVESRNLLHTLHHGFSA